MALAGIKPSEQLSLFSDAFLLWLQCIGRLRQGKQFPACCHQNTFALPVSFQTAMLQDAPPSRAKDTPNMHAKLPKECWVY
jgi:hypothetical protein